MNTLDFFKIAGTYDTLSAKDFTHSVKIHVCTNFTDNILVRLLTGKLLSEKIYPEIFTIPYKQYPAYLKNEQSELFSKKADISFFFFDINQYVPSEFAQNDGAEFFATLENIRSYIQKQKGIVIVNSISLPYQSAYGNLISENHLYTLIEKMNQKISELAHTEKNVYVFDISRVMQLLGENTARDLRGLYAYDNPFTPECFLEIVSGWTNYILASAGKIKKCIVLDLDNTLWGGILGEVGADGIAIGPGYPGLAYQNFQRALLEYYHRGVLLAINSRNNQADVDEVFKNNPHMILKPEHFASVKINWNNKAENLIAIAKELNIGEDSLVFLDDDPINRELVREQLPHILVPDFSLQPEAYIKTLHSLSVFSPFPLTDEDKQKGIMYSQEKMRSETLATAGTFEDYVKNLQIEIAVAENNTAQIGRISQMALKTNQFNFTTKRYSEKDIEALMQDGFIYSFDIKDKFGNYGITAIAILTKGTDTTTLILDSFMMSCRVLGRTVEDALLDFIVSEGNIKGYSVLEIPFISSAKNQPAKEFLERVHVEKSIDIPTYLSEKKLNQHISIKK